MRGWKYSMAVLLAVALIHSPQTAAGDAITLDQAFVRVLERSPRLQAAAFEARAAAARIRQARLAPPLRVDLEVENFAGSGAASGIDAMESTLRLARVLESGQKPRLREELAAHEADLLADEQDAERLDLLADTARRFIHVVTDQERLIIANDAVALDRRILTAVERRIRAGKTAVTEQRRVTIALARSELELEHATHELAASRVKLSTLWGDIDADFATAQAKLFELQPVESLDHLQALLARNPDLVRFATRQRLGATRIRLAEARRRPDVEVSGGLRYLEFSNDVALVANLSIPLASRDRAAPAIEAAQAANDGEPLDYEQRRLVLYATLFEIYQELSHSFTAVDVLRARIIPEAKQALDEYEAGYAAGRYSLLELSAAQRVLLDTRREAVMAASDYHRYRVEVDRLTGAAMTTGEPQ